MGNLREEVRVGTLRRMLRALADTDARLERLCAEGRLPGDAQVQEAAAYRDSLLASIAELEARPDEAAVDVDPRHPTHGWGALAKNPWMPIGADGPEYREILRRIWLRQGGSNEVFEELMPAKPARDGTTYLPEALRVLEGMTPPRRRPAGHVEDAPDPEWLALPPEERAAALERAMSRDGEGDGEA